jgi:hypothetical protein
MERDLCVALCAVGDELRAWETLGVKPKLWWRDDDAHHESTPLQQLCRLLASETLLLAVIPSLLTEDLVWAIKGSPGIAVAQHGWKHLNHATPGYLPNEYPPERSRAEVVQELSAGQIILSEAFPTSFLRVFVPPWHRCATWILREATSLGYDGVSVGAPLFPLLRHGYAGETNIEIDICDWSQGGGFIGANRFAVKIVKALRLRREWSALDTPIGILSHHECLTSKDFACLKGFIALLRDAGVQWLSPKFLFPERDGAVRKIPS